MLNGKGRVALIGDLTGTLNPPLDTRAIFLVDSQSVIKLVRKGETAPGGNGTFQYFNFDISVIEQVALNNDGEVAFMALLSGATRGSGASVGLFAAGVGSGVTEFVRLGDAAPDGNGVFGPRGSDSLGKPFSAPGIHSSGEISFYASLTDTAGGKVSTTTARSVRTAV